MKRFLLAIFVVGLLAACGQSADQQDDTASQDTGQSDAGQSQAQAPGAGTSPPKEMISMDEGLTAFEQAAEAKIRPYFDENATQTEITVAPGDYFDIYVFGEFSTLYPMSAAEYKLVLPENISVMGTAESDSVIITMGKWDTDFMVAFHCAEGPKTWFVKYQCKAHETFTGGEVRTQKGEHLDFIGFTMCDATKTLIRAEGGDAIIHVK